MDPSKNAPAGEKPEEKSGVKKLADNVKATFQDHKGHGPAVPQDFNVAQEGTKEERRARTEELNK